MLVVFVWGFSANQPRDDFRYPLSCGCDLQLLLLEPSELIVILMLSGFAFDSGKQLGDAGKTSAQVKLVQLWCCCPSYRDHSRWLLESCKLERAPLYNAAEPRSSWIAPICRGVSEEKVEIRALRYGVDSCQ